MHLDIDIREACRARPTGKGVWTRGWLAELLTRPVAVTLRSDHPLPADLQTIVANRSAPTNIRITPSRWGLWHLETALDLWRRAKPDTIYVSPTSYIVPALLGKRLATAPVVHDLIAFDGQPHNWRARLIERLTLGRCVRLASRLLTISAATRSDLLRRYPGRNPLSVTSIFAGPKLAAPAASLRDQQNILCIGTLSPRKNQLELVRAFSRLPERLRTDWRLILVGGRGWHDDDILAAVQQTPNVEWRSYTPESELDDLLHHCRIVALPSLYEGFGLPVLDAFQRGIPVLTSARGSLQELAGGAAFIVNPQDTAAIARGLEILMTDSVLADDLAKRGPVRASRYSWQKTVDLSLQALAPAH